MKRRMEVYGTVLVVYVVLLGLAYGWLYSKVPEARYENGVYWLYDVKFFSVGTSDGHMEGGKAGKLEAIVRGRDVVMNFQYGGRRYTATVPLDGGWCLPFIYNPNKCLPRGPHIITEDISRKGELVENKIGGQVALRRLVSGEILTYKVDGKEHRKSQFYMITYGPYSRVVYEMKGVIPGVSDVFQLTYDKVYGVLPNIHEFAPMSMSLVETNVPLEHRDYAFILIIVGIVAILIVLIIAII